MITVGTIIKRNENNTNDIDAQINTLLRFQFEHKQEPAEDQSEGGRPRDGGHSQPYTGD